MKKLTVLSYTADTDAIVRKLMNLKCVEIRSTAPKDGLLPLDLMQCDAQKAEAVIREKAKNADVALICGGQPIYDYIISVE